MLYAVWVWKLPTPYGLSSRLNRSSVTFGVPLRLYLNQVHRESMTVST